MELEEQKLFDVRVKLKDGADITFLMTEDACQEARLFPGGQTCFIEFKEINAITYVAYDQIVFVTMSEWSKKDE